MEFKNASHFFKAVKNDKLLPIDIWNYTEKVTNNYDISKLEDFIESLQTYFMEWKFTIAPDEKRLTHEIEYLKHLGRPIPKYKTPQFLIAESKGLSTDGIREYSDEINYDKILGGYKYKRLEDLQNELKAKLLEVKKGLQDKDKKASNKNTNIEDSLTIDLSDTKLTEKIIMLEKLGVLKFLRDKEPFNLSINALASVISGITGEKQSVIQSYINPIFTPNKTVFQKNNPLTKAKPVSKVIQKLNSIGFVTHD